MTIIIIGSNQINEIKTCVGSIRQFCDLEYVNVVVIDNCSTDGTKAWLENQNDLAFGVTEEEEGIAQILNETIAMFQLEDDLLLMKPNCMITRGYLSNTLQALYQEERVAIVEPIVYSMDSKQQNDAILFKKSVLSEVGAFDESNADWDNSIKTYKDRIVAFGHQTALTYIQLFPFNESMEEILMKLQKSSCQLDKNGKIFMKFPVARPGEKPRYSYEDIYAAFYQKSLLIKNVKAAHFICGEDAVIGYELSVERKREKRLLMITAGNVLVEYNIRQIGQAYEKLGWEVIYRKTDDFHSGEINNVVESGIDKVFVINNVGWITNKEQDEKSWWDKLGIKSYNFVLDHPMYYDDTLSKAPELGTLLCVDKNHVQYVNRFYPNVNQAFFLPLGGDNNLDGIEKDWNERNIEVLYVGGYKGDLDVSQLPKNSEPILEKLLQNMDCTTEDVIEQEIKALKGALSEAQLKEEIINYKMIDWYIMTYIRVEVVRVLIKGGINVTVYGSNWEKFEYYNSPHFIHKGLVTQEQCLEKMKDSKIVLNVMPWFKNGTHDRVINAMLAGAVCLTDGNDYMDEVFEKDKDYVCFERQHLEQLPDIVRRILSSDNKEMRMRAYHKAKEGHRWLQRLEMLEKILERA